MSFGTSLIGHTLQKEQLLSDLEKDNIAHAYLFCGPAHIGKHTLALAFASKLLLQGVPEDEVSKVQHSIDTLTHPDLLVLDKLWMADTLSDWNELALHSNVPQEHRAKKKVKTDIISIDDVRALQERLYETGTGRWRVCIITSIERMQSEAANAFLKMLEEPPQGLVFLLTTQAQSHLLPTIVSRARKVPFQRVSPREMQVLLSGTAEDDATFITHIACGAPGLAVTLRDDPDVLCLHKTVHATAQNFWLSRSASERMRILTPLHKRSEEAENLFLHLGLALRRQSVDVRQYGAKAYTRLAAGFQTNAHRQLLSQRFALEAATK